MENGRGHAVAYRLRDRDRERRRLHGFQDYAWQDSLNNVARHAGAATVMVTLRHGDDAPRLLVEDDGKRTSQQEVESPRSFGLPGMRERAAVFGGKLSIRGESGVGARVCVTIPMAILEEGRECTDS